jgi:hypothetical protein
LREPQSQESVKIVLKKSTSSRVLGGILLSLAVLTVATMYSLDWRPSFDQENLVEMLYENALPGVGLFMLVALVVTGLFFLTKDVLETDPLKETLSHRLVPPLQPTHRYRFSDFHTVGAETHRTENGVHYTLELKGGTKKLTLVETDIGTAQGHAKQLATCCRLGYQGFPYWEIPEERLDSARPPTRRNKPIGLSVKRRNEGGFEVVFTKSTTWRWLVLLPFMGLIAASQWALLPWYFYLLWTALAAGIVAWIAWRGKDHRLSVENNIVTYFNHSNTELYSVNLLQHNFLEMKGDEIVCARPGDYLVLELPRATKKQKAWIKDEMLRTVAEEKY